MYYTELRSYASKLSRNQARRESGFRRFCQVLYLYIQGHFDYPYYASQASLPKRTSSLRLIYHFLDIGRFQLLNPNHLFDTGFYISAYLDVARSGVNPYLHFLRDGWRHGRRPCAVFDGFEFLEKAGIAPGLNPVQVYASQGLVDLGPFFDKAFYLASNADVRDSRTDPVYHYLRYGRREGRQPNSWIDPAFYSEIYGSNKDALEDYQIFGDLLERDPSPGFDGEGYNARQRLPNDRCFSALEHYLGQPSIVGPPAPSQIFLRQQRAEALISKTTRGVLALESFRDLLSTDDGSLEIVSGDPQLVFRWVDDCDLTELVALGLTARSANPKEPVNPQLFVDYGTGWTESASAIMEPAGEDRWLAYIPFPRAALKVRLDVSSVPMTMKLLNVNCEPFAKDALSDPMPAAWHDWMLNIICAPSSGRSVHDELAATYVKLNPRRTYVSRYQYQEWIRCHPLSAAAKARQSKFPVAETPETLFSVIIPVYNPPLNYFSMLIDCLERQTFRNFEVCIADDCSTDSAVRPFLESLYEREIQVRLTFLEKNGHISVASNAAAALATGTFLVLVDQDDLIPVEALEIVAQTIEEHPNCAVLFSDEDKIDVSNNRSDPYFKGNFDNFLLYGHNMVSHLGVYSRDLFLDIGGFTVGLEGAQDYDLALRAYEALGGENRIVHIPYVLYHWRVIPGSTALDSSQKEYAIVAAQNAINSHFKRCHLPYRSDDTTFARGTSHVTIVKSDRKSELISFVIPSKNDIQTLDSCIRSLYSTNDDEFEVIIVDNGSDRHDVLTYLHQLEASYPDTRVVYFPGNFNYSAMNNLGRRSARGSILGLLNNDTEVIASDFMDRVRAHLRSEEIGTVGARLFYENFAVQHFGIYLGIGEHAVAGAAHHGSHRSDPGPYAKGRLLQQFEAVTAACLFTRTETYDRVGGFDESFPVAYNDIDFCLKVRSLGLKIICDPDIEFFHKESFSRGPDTTPEKASRLASEGERMRAKWAQMLCNDRFYSPNFSNENTSMQLAFPPRLFPFSMTSSL